MVIIKINDESFLYDVYGLVQAFYPGTKPKVITPASSEETDRGADDLFLAIQIGQDEIEISQNDAPANTTRVAGLPRKEVKNRLKRLLYDILSDGGKKTLPWGTLTGVRPTKIPLKMFREQKTEDEIASYMKETYLCSDEKIALATGIARRELDVIGDIQNKYALYIGIPFCPSICLYCSFSSYPVSRYRQMMDDYVDALIREITFLGEYFSDRTADAVYIGGGTPTSLSERQLKRLLGAIREHIDLSGIREFTVEAGRPDSVTREKLEIMAEHGVDRISVNPQTMQQKTLDLIGRCHTVDQVYAAFEAARLVSEKSRANGKKSFLINTDLIIGLPGEEKPDVADTLRQILNLRPDNLTVHSLAIKRSSRLNLEWDRYGGAMLPNSDELMDEVHRAAEKMNMTPYYMYRQKQISGNLENVGFSPPHKECLYNIEMMEELCDVAALGAGSVSKRVGVSADGGIDLKVKVERAANVKDVEQYILRTDEMIERKRRLFCARES